MSDDPKKDEMSSNNNSTAEGNMGKIYLNENESHYEMTMQRYTAAVIYITLI
jgi:hypothetical protein